MYVIRHPLLNDSLPNTLPLVSVFTFCIYVYLKIKFIDEIGEKSSWQIFLFYIYIKFWKKKVFYIHYSVTNDLSYRLDTYIQLIQYQSLSKCNIIPILLIKCGECLPHYNNLFIFNIYLYWSKPIFSIGFAH